MSKGLKALEVSKQLKDFVLEFVKNGLDIIFVRGSFNIIEKELKEAEENKKMLEIFKNALTIEHHEIPLELINSSDMHEFISGITKQITTIKQNELDKSLRKNLRDWVLKKAFPKELKQKEKLERDYELLKKQYDELLFTANDLNNENIELLRHKKAIDFIKSRGGKVVRNALGYWFEGTFKIAEEEYDEFKEVLKDE